MRRFLAIDVGGSAIKYGVVENGTNILYKNDCPTPKDTMAHLLEAFQGIHADCLDYGPFIGVAISFTASMDGRTGFCYGGSLESYTKGENLLETFQSVFAEPVAVENDGNCAALSEARYGALKGLESGIMITLGTGLGGGLVQNGQIYHGKHSCSGEFSYILVNGADAFHAPEAWAGLNGRHMLADRMQQETGKPVPDGKAFFALAEQGDADALRILNEFTERLTVGLFNLQCVYAPDKIAIGGGISRQPLLMEMLHQKIDLFYANTGVCLPRMEVVQAEFLSDANLIGAVCWWEDFYESGIK